MECGSLMLTSHMPQTEINETSIVFIVSSRLAVYFLAKYFLLRKSKHFLGSTYFLEKIWQKIIGILCWPLLDFMTLNSIRLALSQEGLQTVGILCDQGIMGKSAKAGTSLI